MKKETVALFALTVIAAGIVYAITICPTVELIDSGELAMACRHLGIAHPTGYPLYTLLGNIAARIPVGSLILRENAMSLLFTAFAAGFLFLFLTAILRKYGETLKDKIIAAITALLVAFSPVWWSQGTTNEVYSLNLLLIPVSLWALFNFSISGKNCYRWLTFAVYSLGLCLANHLSVIYVIPAVLYIIIIEIRSRRLSWAAFGKLGVFLIFPVTLYLFLPIRAQFKPFLNWGSVNDAYLFYKHITGWQYRVWMFENPLGIFENLSARLGPAAGLIYDQFKWHGLPLAFAGIGVAWFRYRRYLIFAILVWLANLVYVLNYEIVDIESYYLPMIIVTSAFIAFAASEVLRALEQRGRRIWIRMALAAFLLLPLVNLWANFYKADRSHKVFARQVVLDMARSIEPGGIAIVENWDFYSPWLYMRFEENFRTDIVLLDKELMRRSWYVDFIRREHPEIYVHSRPAFEEFMKRVVAFDRDQPYDPYVLDEAYYSMFDAIIRNEVPIRPVYTNVFTDKLFVKGRPLIPSGIVFRYDNPNMFRPYPRFEFAGDIWGDPRVYKEPRIWNLLYFYSRAFESRQKYCVYFGQADEARYYADLKGKVEAIKAEIKMPAPPDEIN